MADAIYNDPPENVTFEAIKVEEPLYSAFLANAIFNGCLCHSTIMLNVVTIYALRKTSALSNTLKALLLNLAVADLGIGLLGQPLEVVYLREKLRWNQASTATDRASAVVLSVFYISSLFGIMAISANRFIAIQMPLRYEDLVTHRRVVTVVITIWLFSALISPCSVFLLTTNTTFAFFVIVESIFFLSTTLLYYKIYLTIRRHKEQILKCNNLWKITTWQIRQESQNLQVAHFAFICYFGFVIYLIFSFRLLVAYSGIKV